MSNIRTDLAVESRQAYCQQQGREPEGVDFSEHTVQGFHVSTMRVHTKDAARQMDKPVGTYITMSLDRLISRQENAFVNAAQCLGSLFGEFPDIPSKGLVLIAGLGNRAMTPDALGPMAIDSVLVTRHLIRQVPEFFGSMRPVTAVATGVLGTTGMEASEMVRALMERLEPVLVIAIDALASRSMDRLCRTVQLSDSGIVPGSGVGNARAALNRDSLGVPVISVGVPTVVDAATMALDVCPDGNPDAGVLQKAQRLFVTPRDIDASVSACAKLIGYGIDLAMHDGLCVEDVDMLLG